MDKDVINRLNESQKLALYSLAKLHLADHHNAGFVEMFNVYFLVPDYHHDNVRYIKQWGGGVAERLFLQQLPQFEKKDIEDLQKLGLLSERGVVYKQIDRFVFSNLGPTVDLFILFDDIESTVKPEHGSKNDPASLTLPINIFK
ncbi:hypothetical protein [uncultured Photobacterium sp.]|uniref:hypothetical protein n=1 Tax=uncultured Photobacterium sp. TaxID=173973 RepID=UPI002624EEDF|nr:hypothetical protein [uncultured Photobacterium sp.]